MKLVANIIAFALTLLIYGVISRLTGWGFEHVLLYGTAYAVCAAIVDAEWERI